MISGNFVLPQRFGKYWTYPKHREITFLLQTKQSCWKRIFAFQTQAFARGNPCEIFCCVSNGEPCWRHVSTVTCNQVLRAQAVLDWPTLQELSLPLLLALESGYLILSGLVAFSLLPSPYSGLDLQQLGSVLPSSSAEDSVICWSYIPVFIYSVYSSIIFTAPPPSCHQASLVTVPSWGTMVSWSSADIAATFCLKVGWIQCSRC